MTDPVLAMAQGHPTVDNQQFVEFALKYAGVLASTPHDRIERAIAEEIADLIERARAGIAAHASAANEAVIREALATLEPDDAFPRDALDALAARLRATTSPPSPEPIVSEIESWTSRHRALEKRLAWLLNGTPAERRAALDPLRDADELHHILVAEFRFEARVLEMLSINRIAQSASIGTFFRSTKEAESNSVMRFFDTYALYANVFEWGLDSLRGRTAMDRMNQIHGRYYIPNDEMKFVLLQGCFTWLDGADRIGHRRVADNERRGMLAAWARMGQAMHIQDLSEDYDAMYAWYRDVCTATAEHKPYKRSTFELIIGASIAGTPALRSGLFLAAQVAMDDTYRSATGYPEPTKDQKQAVRAVFFTVGSLIEKLPYSPYIRSLANNPIRRAWTDPKDLGAADRSKHMPPAFAHLPNAGFPERQKPLSSPGSAGTMEYPAITWEEIRTKAGEGFAWIVVDGYVYDLTVIRDFHPGGTTILQRWSGKDATRAYNAAKHSNGTLVFSLNYRIGRVVGDEPRAVEPGAERDAVADVVAAATYHRKSGSFPIPPSTILGD